MPTAPATLDSIFKTQVAPGPAGAQQPMNPATSKTLGDIFGSSNDGPAGQATTKSFLNSTFNAPPPQPLAPGSGPDGILGDTPQAAAARKATALHNTPAGKAVIAGTEDVASGVAKQGSKIIQGMKDQQQESFNAIGEDVKSGAEDIRTAGKNLGEGDLGGAIKNTGKAVVQAGLGTASDAISYFFAPLTSIVKNTVSTVAGANPDAPGISDLKPAQYIATGPVGDAVQAVQDRFQKAVEAHPVLAKALSDAFNVVTTAAGGAEAPEALDTLGTGISKDASTLSSAIEKTKSAVSNFNLSDEELKTLGYKTVKDAAPGTMPEPIDPQIKATVDKRVQTLQGISKNNGPIGRIVADARGRGVDVENAVANTDLLQGSVDETGTINTTQKGGAVEQFNDFMGKYETAVTDGLAKEGKTVPFEDVEAALKKGIEDSHVAGGAKARMAAHVESEIAGLALDKNPDGTISLSKLQDAKISSTRGVDYTKPETKINAKMSADVYRTMIEENSSLPVKDINKELSSYYKIADYLEALNGKKVQGGKLGVYFAKTVGAIAGSHFGPLGSIIGAELAGKIKGSAMESTFGGLINQEMKPSKLLETTVQENNRGDLKTTQSTKTMNSNNSSIPDKPIIKAPKSQTIGERQAGKISTKKGMVNPGQIVSDIKAGVERVSKAFTNDVAPKIYKELRNYKTFEPLTINGNPNMGTVSTELRIEELQNAARKGVLTTDELKEAQKLLKSVGIKIS